MREVKKKIPEHALLSTQNLFLRFGEGGEN